MRYKVLCSYDGTKYAGFQSQKNALAIQDVIEKALSNVFKEEIKITLASRTDAGVHALGQVFSFESDKEIKPYNVKSGGNTFLPDDIHLIDAEVVSNEFHPRYMVKEKTYRYLINLGEFNPLYINRMYQCPYKLDIELMKQGAKILIGKHDFGSFNTSSYKDYPNQVRKIRKFNLSINDNILTIEVIGDGFLKNMVRIMVGSLIELGRGKKSLLDIKEMLDNPNKGTRRYNAPAGGLYLIEIKY